MGGGGSFNGMVTSGRNGKRSQAGKTEIGRDMADTNPDGRTYRQADRQRRRQASRQTEKETDRQDRDRERWGRY